MACFQPHLYSRTRLLAREFGQALALADLVVVSTSTRPASAPRTSRALRAARRRAPRRTPPAAARSGGSRSLDEAAARLASELGEGDVLLTMGAGDVDVSLAR